MPWAASPPLRRITASPKRPDEARRAAGRDRLGSIGLAGTIGLKQPAAHSPLPAPAADTQVAHLGDEPAAPVGVHEPPVKADSAKKTAEAHRWILTGVAPQLAFPLAAARAKAGGSNDTFHNSQHAANFLTCDRRRPIGPAWKDYPYGLHDSDDLSRVAALPRALVISSPRASCSVMTTSSSGSPW